MYLTIKLKKDVDSVTTHNAAIRQHRPRELKHRLLLLRGTITQIFVSLSFSFRVQARGYC